MLSAAGPAVAVAQAPSTAQYLPLFLVFWPLISSLVVLVASRRWTDRQSTLFGVLASVVELFFTVAALLHSFPFTVPGARLDFDRPWIPALGVRLHLMLDGLSAPLVALTAVLGLLVCIYLLKIKPVGPPLGGLIAAIQMVIAGAMGTFLAADLLVFFIAFEMVLIPMWFIIAVWGDTSSTAPLHRVGSSRPTGLAARSDAAARFLLYTGLGSAFMLLGLLLLAAQTGTTDMVALASAAGQSLSPRSQAFIAVLILAGLFVKTPGWPLHSWLPPAHTIAPTVGSVLLAGVLLKLGTYAMVRICLGALPEGMLTLAPALGILGVIGIWWGGLVCLAETDLKRLIAMSSVAHMGFVLVGIASMTPAGVQGAMFANVAHGVITGLLFFVVGALKDRHHSAELTVIGTGLRDRMPRLGWLLAFACIAALGLPGLAGFWGELLAIVGAFQAAGESDRTLWLVIGSASAAGTLLAAAYLLRVLYRIWQGEPPAHPPLAGDASSFELRVWVPLVAATIILGLMPWLVLDTTSTATQSLTTVMTRGESLRPEGIAP